MKLKCQLAAFAAVAVFAGCSENNQPGTQPQSVAPSVTNEAKEAASARAPAPPPPPLPVPSASNRQASAVAPQVKPDPASANTPPATPPANGEPGDKK